MNLLSQKLKSDIVCKLLISFLLLTACQQPPTGELEPLANEGATLTTSRFENDTLLFSEDGLSVKFYGSWEGAIGLRVAVQNKTGKDVVVRFDELAAENGKGERARIGDITERQSGEFTYIRRSLIGKEENKDKAPEVKVLAGTQRKFTVVLSKIFSYGKDDKADTIYITLPFEIDEKTKAVKEFKTVFREIERKTNDTPDPEAW